MLKRRWLLPAPTLRTLSPGVWAYAGSQSSKFAHNPSHKKLHLYGVRVSEFEDWEKNSHFICVSAIFRFLRPLRNPPWHLLCTLRRRHCVFGTAYVRSARPMPPQTPYCVFSRLLLTLRSLTPLASSMLLRTQRSRSALSAPTKRPSVSSTYPLTPHYIQSLTPASRR